MLTVLDVPSVVVHFGPRARDMGVRRNKAGRINGNPKKEKSFSALKSTPCLSLPFLVFLCLCPAVAKEKRSFSPGMSPPPFLLFLCNPLSSGLICPVQARRVQLLLFNQPIGEVRWKREGESVKVNGGGTHQRQSFLLLKSSPLFLSSTDRE
ncbi:hypothetical protein Baya_10436 [Bagarius yarrelli]|uniref:Uncharacterized protein n=1 Tax=Bagarius yarrelli TaxID=175774 RepID=A0A556UF91_BAGYA|nr:hypothetical protein Baya_10436 [Bagarius yarrelli]